MIKQISKITSPEILAELRTFPTQAFIWEIVDTGMSGKIFELEEGGILILENSNNPFVFIAGILTDKSAQAVISFLQNHQDPLIYCKPSYHSFFLKRGFDLLLRVELVLRDLERFCNDDSIDFFSNPTCAGDLYVGAVLESSCTLKYTPVLRSAPPSNPLPQASLERSLLGNAVKPIDNVELFQKCFWYKENLELYGSAENFLKYCKGYAYVENDQVLSEAYGSIGGGYMEVSVATHPDHRGKGYVAKALTPLIKKCEVEGLIPIWSCQLDNRSSLKAALKLGFEIDRYYVTMVPECGNVLSANLVKWLKDSPDLQANPFL